MAVRVVQVVGAGLNSDLESAVVVATPNLTESMASTFVRCVSYGPLIPERLSDDLSANPVLINSPLAAYPLDYFIGRTDEITRHSWVASVGGRAPGVVERRVVRAVLGHAPYGSSASRFRRQHRPHRERIESGGGRLRRCRWLRCRTRRSRRLRCAGRGGASCCAGRGRWKSAGSCRCSQTGRWVYTNRSSVPGRRPIESVGGLARSNYLVALILCGGVTGNRSGDDGEGGSEEP